MDIGNETLVSKANVGLLDYIIIAARGWKIVLLTILVTTVAMVIYLNIATYKYTATVKLTTSQSAGGLGSQLGNLGALASIASVRLPQGAGEQNFLNFSQSLLSRSTAEGLLKRPELLHVMFEQEWDATSQQWVEPKGPIKTIAGVGRKILGLPVYPFRPPDAARVQKYLETYVGVAEDTRKPVISITYSHKDPNFAVNLLDAIASIDDETLRRKSLTRSTNYIAYLEGQLRVAQLAESRTALALVLGEQVKQRMLASANAPFAAEPISAISVSDQPTAPKPIIFLITAVVAGLIIGVLLVLVRADFKATHSQQ